MRPLEAFLRLQLEAVDPLGVEWPRPTSQIMALSLGTRLRHYDVTALLGEATGRRALQSFGRKTFEPVTGRGVLLAVGVGRFVASPSGAQTDPPRTA